MTQGGGYRRPGSPPIGGFFELHAAGEPTGGASLLEAWTGGRSYAAFVSARAALAALFAAVPETTLWAPAFLCAEALLPEVAARTRFYPVEAGFEPDLELVAGQAEPGDFVLLVAHFGLPISHSASALAGRRPDLRLVEDRAQALDAGEGLPSAWRLFSPRKLFGVADGGLLVAPPGGTAPPPSSPSVSAAALWRPAMLRSQDPSGRENEAWYAAQQAKEASMAVAGGAMTPRSLEMIGATPLTALAERRLANWRRLHDALSRWSALPAEPAAPPLGYVLELSEEARGALLRHLHAQRIFAAVHWPRLASQAEAFPREHAWTRRLVTLPCDHRYSAEDMDRISDAVTHILR